MMGAWEGKLGKYYRGISQDFLLYVSEAVSRRGWHGFLPLWMGTPVFINFYVLLILKKWFSSPN